ncbi:Acb2/Tad1 domain-containing protein [Segnochrobactrum spirostomi]|uniref:Acb2/Tad1 hairpin domain-containing protein n=1 Tax=Segnochrobactrum spirostomi TaxID=2608987 RepID=A0A6A7Y4I3_9HYPH|nr:hypothetical protein [Segnochrobactrum spirostomi]MQT13645.1 hypothetical protein [Segnochrobactrum spirostomi]
MTTPFDEAVRAGPPAAGDSPAFEVFGVHYAAQALWELLDALPGKAEATLAKRRLQEAVFWGQQAARPIAPQPRTE